MTNQQINKLIPKGWNEVQVIKYLDLCSFKLDDFETELDYLINHVSILLDVEYSIIEALPIEQFYDIVEKCQFSFRNPVMKKPEPVLKTEQADFYLIDNLNSLDVKEIIDLSEYCKDFIHHFYTILAILYRPEISAPTDLHPRQLEHYGNYLYYRRYIFEECIIEDVFGVINYFQSWFNAKIEAYRGLFSSDDDNLTEEEKKAIEEQEKEEYEQMSEIEKRKFDEQKAKEETFKRWNWELFLLMCTDNYSIPQSKDVLDYNFVFCLKMLSTKMELGLLKK